jgi:hypothetical protein
MIEQVQSASQRGKSPSKVPNSKVPSSFSIKTKINTKI